MHNDDLDLKEEVIAGLRRLLPNQGQNTFRVISAHPVKPSLLPCISVVQASGGLGPETIGDQFDEPVQNDETLEWFSVAGSYYRQSVEITIWALSPTDRDTLKRHVRKALWKLRRQLGTDKDFHQATLSEQGDSQDFEQQQPRDIFMFTFELAGVAPITETTPMEEPAEAVTVGMVMLSDEVEDDG